MAAVGFVTDVTLLDRAGSPVAGLGTKQNFFVDAADFLAFGYGFTGGSTAGDQSRSQLVIQANQLTLNYFYEAFINRHLVKAENFEIDLVLMTKGIKISEELWNIGSLSHDQLRLTVELRGPGDATKRGPGRFLNQTLVGSIPPSGTLLLS